VQRLPIVAVTRVNRGVLTDQELDHSCEAVTRRHVQLYTDIHLYTVLKYPHIHGHLVASSPHFNVTGSVCVRIRKSTE